MKVFFVGAGAGDPELLTLKAHRMLSNCSCCIYAGSLVSPAVIELIPENAERYDSASMNLDEIIAVYRQARERDIDVIRLHTGDPAIYSAVAEQIDALNQLGIEYETVPGISSFQAAAAALKVELTVPEIVQTVILTRTAGRTPMPPEQELERLAAAKATLCVFLSVHNIERVAETIARHYGTDCPVAVIYRASWPDQIIVQGTVADIAAKVAESGIRKTAMTIVGPALKSSTTTSKLYDRNFSHEYRNSQK